MAEKDSQSNSQNQQRQIQLSQEQYEILKSCSEKADMTEWNKWREEHPDEEIWLQAASLEGAHLKYANLIQAHLENANLLEAHLENAYLIRAHLENVILRKAHLENAHLWEIHLENANLLEAHLENAHLWAAHLENAILTQAHLENAYLGEAHLQGAYFMGANLKGADFSRAIVDGGTLVWGCQVDRNTTFEAVGLESIRISSATRELLEYNMRRMHWQKWYDKGWLLTRIAKRLFVRPFWWISNYGLSTWRIILTFFVLAIIFATVYFVYGAYDYYLLGTKEQPGIVKDLFVPVTQDKPMSDVYYGAMIYFRAVYFSVVTMTTLGFGDMYANTASFSLRWWVGHLLLIMQVILGYVLLGALVTRFAVLFTAGGPAGKFTEKEQKSEQRQ